MFANCLKITLRNLKKHKGYSFINIFGLAVGMACCILILLYISDELSFDSVHRKAERIYRVGAISSVGPSTRQYAITPPALGPAVAAAVPDVEAAVRISRPFEFQGRLGSQNVRIPEVQYADPNFFQVFSYDFIAGDKDKALAGGPDAIVLTQETARRLFGGANALGRTIDLSPTRAVQVTGIVQNPPRNSSLRFDALMPTTSLRDAEGRPSEWLAAPFYCEIYTFLLAKPGSNPRDLAAKIMAVHETNWGQMFKQRGVARQYPLIGLRDIHLRSKSLYEVGTPGDINNVYLFSGIALFVLLIACFNFINLSTARAAGRAREVGLRKVFGSRKEQLVRQFLGESIGLSLLSLVLGALIVFLAMPAFNSLAGKPFVLSHLATLPVVLGFLGIVILAGVIAGSFPAFLLSSFRPVTVLKGRFSSASKNSPLRKILVVVQFSISVFMVIGILTIIRQLDFMKNKDLGFNRKQLVTMDAYAQRNSDALKTRLLSHPGVVSVSSSTNIPGGAMGSSVFLLEGKAPEETVRAFIFFVDYDFVKTYEMAVVEGRDFSRDLSTDAGEAVLVNEKMAGLLGGGKSILGKRIMNVPQNNRAGRIVGVVKDFHTGSLKLDILPAVLSLEPRVSGTMTARIRTTNIPETLKFLEDVLREASLQAAPDREFVFNYHFVDDDFRNKYREEERVGYIYLIFGGLAILVACLGLFGLASFTLEQRTKEIGIRKVLGASSTGILLLLSREFMTLILAAVVLAWPVAYYAMSGWLGNFAYRISVGWDLFFLSGVIAGLVAVLTILYHSVRAVLANPCSALRSE